MSNGRGWIGVDLDGTLAQYTGWKGANHIGDPVPAMLGRVQTWLAQGREVRILTARCWPLLLVRPDEKKWHITERADGSLNTNGLPIFPTNDRVRLEEAVAAVDAIRLWCAVHVGCMLPVTCVKDYSMVEMYDDRCKQVEPNTGVLIEDMLRVGAER